VKILLVEDDPGIRKELHRGLTRVGGFPVETAANGSEAVAKLEGEVFDLVLTDVKMPSMDGIALLRFVKETRPETMVILMTGFGSIEAAVEAMKMGADDYITKPINFNDLLFRISKAGKSAQIQEENRLLRREVTRKFDFGNIIGKSPKMREVFSLIEKVAPSNSTVVVYGGSGTGKELVAKAIHFHSPRANHPFLPFNSAAIPETLIETELFGHMKGAFTGAIKPRRGLFEEAKEGTLFLDEIGAIHPSVQVKLLRVLQEREVMRVGSSERIKVDVRVIAATNENLEAKMKAGAFREDLFYRLHVFPIFLPYLKDRREDIPLLADHFLSRFAPEHRKVIRGFSKEAQEALLDYSWPGNVRELENVLERAVILADNEYLTLEELPAFFREKSAVLIKAGAREEKSMEEVRTEYIMEILRKVNGNRGEAARILKVNPKTLYRFEKTLSSAKS
jgi:DNA-binding NtrC family response regulator